MNNVREIDITKTITSLEVAEMVEKDHSKLLRDIRNYSEKLTEAKIGLSDFFIKSTYIDSTGRTLPCYKVTKKGCEFIAHKLTGTKGTAFTARYINRFHEMEDIISHKETKSALPWFIRRFEGEYIMPFRDFKTITGVQISGNYTALKRPEHLIGGRDYNGWGWYTVVNKEEFKQKYGFDYGDDKCMMYLYSCGIVKALNILINDKTNIKEETFKMIIDGIKSITPHKEVKAITQTQDNIIVDDIKRNLPVNINITIGVETEGCRNNILI